MLRFVIADDNPIFIESLSIILENQPDIEVAGTAADGLDAIGACSELKPDIMLLDISMPRMDGIEATKEIKRACPEVKVVIMTSLERKEDIKAAIKNGACGYIMKGTGSELLILLLRCISCGYYVFCDSAGAILFDELNRRNVPEALKYDLNNDWL